MINLKSAAIAALIISRMFVDVAGGGILPRKKFKATLTGMEEVPPVVTDITGMATLKFAQDFSSLAFSFTVDTDPDIGVPGVPGVHLHCAPKGANGPVAVFLAGDLSGGIVHEGSITVGGTLVDGDVMGAAGCGMNLLELAENMADGNVYVNVHSNANLPGEVRGQVIADKTMNKKKKKKKKH